MPLQKGPILKCGKLMDACLFITFLCKKYLSRCISHISPYERERHGRDRMVVGFTTTYVITANVVYSNPAQARCTRYNIV